MCLEGIVIPPITQILSLEDIGKFPHFNFERIGKYMRTCAWRTLLSLYFFKLGK